MLILAGLALLLAPSLPHAAGSKPKTHLRLNRCYPRPPIYPESMLSDSFDSVISYLLFYNHQTCVVGNSDWRLQLCGKVGEWFRWIEPGRNSQTVDPVKERRRKALLHFSNLVHRDAQTREQLVRELVAYARQCNLTEIGAAVLSVFEQELNRYVEARHLPAVASCRMTCNPGQHPRWGLGAWGKGYTNDCFEGCGQEYKKAFEDRALPRFIHRRVLQGIPVKEMRKLIGLARSELGR